MHFIIVKLRLRMWEDVEDELNEKRYYENKIY